MSWIEAFFNTVPTSWAIIALIAAIGLSVLFLRGLIRLAFRAFIIGSFGLIIIGVIYFLF